MEMMPFPSLLLDMCSHNIHLCMRVHRALAHRYDHPRTDRGASDRYVPCFLGETQQLCADEEHNSIIESVALIYVVPIGMIQAVTNTQVGLK
jgi:hypothetical protein